MAGASIEVRGLHHRFASRAGEVTVLDGLDLDVAAGGYVALVGASGAGKSTLLSVIGGLESAQAGTVVVGGQDLGGLNRSELARFRRETVGFVFQHFGLLEALTAAENIELACSLARMAPAVRRAKVRGLLDAVDLGDRARHRPVELSGGERQRVAIARALANGPSLVLADEPTGNLDDASTNRVVTLLESLPADHGCTLVLVTHDLAIAERAPRRVRLRGGRALDDTAATTDGAAHASSAGAAP
ncbi:MAG TPA: ABC transporter ATP-binding protein [Acidimicrobiales bacterium]